MSTLDERIKNNSIEDQLYIGELIENTTKGEFGKLLKLIINGMIAEWLSASEDDNKITADRYLGRIEALNKLTDRLDYCVEIKNRLLEENRNNKEV